MKPEWVTVAIGAVTRVARGIAQERGWEVLDVCRDLFTGAILVRFAVPNGRWFQFLVDPSEVVSHVGGPRFAVRKHLHGKDLGGPFERESWA